MELEAIGEEDEGDKEGQGLRGDADVLGDVFMYMYVRARMVVVMSPGMAYFVLEVQLVVHFLSGCVAKINTP